MAFSGNLEHIPLVDIIQLLHGTRKSGILKIAGRRGESRLVFKDGFIVSASHLNNRVRIGAFMVERADITAAALEQALTAQQQAGRARQPLIQTLLGLDLVEEEKAYVALQALISMTIVEILTWSSGVFLLEPTRDAIKDDFKYYPDHLEREVNVEVQGALLDALRIYDEKLRDGELTLEQDPAAEEYDEIAAALLGLPDAAEETAPPVHEPLEELTAEDLGLSELEQL
jgi:hypothetical protein